MLVLRTFVISSKAALAEAAAEMAKKLQNPLANIKAIMTDRLDLTYHILMMIISVSVYAIHRIIRTKFLVPSDTWLKNQPVIIWIFITGRPVRGLFMKMACIFLLSTLCFQAAMAETSKSITFMWEWSPSGLGYTSGPNMDVAYDIYMRTGDDPGYGYDYPLISEIDNCWWNQDRYSCTAALDYNFSDGVSYRFVAVAYLVEDPNQRSGPSNEIEYCPDCPEHVVASSSGLSGSSGGGGCFMNSAMQTIFNLPGDFVEH